MPKVTARLVDADTKKPIPWIKGAIGNYTDDADVDGILEWFDVPAGTYPLIIKATFYTKHVQNIQVKDVDLDLGTIALRSAVI